jgi:solute carrier family 25 (mitochondrial phosphate transporter), member 23/24/25/41
LNIMGAPKKYKFASISISARELKKPGASHAAPRSLSSPASGGNLVFELGVASTQPRPSIATLAVKRPVALLALVPRAAVLFGAGAVSGAIAKSITAPLDRVKILLQVKGGLEKGVIGKAAASGSLIQSLLAVGRQEGIAGYWRGNLPQVLRVVPYSAAQLYSYEVFKKWFAEEDGRLPVHKRLAAGACAGMTATLVSATYELHVTPHLSVS